MSISAMKCALQSLESVEKVNGWNKNSVVGRHCTQSAHFLRQAIAEAEKPWVKTYCGGKPNYTTPEQEPVAWREVAGKFTHYYDYNEDGRGEPLYSAPQPDLARVGEVGVWGDKREWVGLTQAEFEQAVDGLEDLEDCWTAIEAKLKEKNT
jgi:hypothetical protein